MPKVKITNQNCKKEKKISHKVDKSKIKISTELYLDLLSETVVRDYRSNERKYTNVTNLIDGLYEVFGIQRTFRLPSDHSQREYIKDFTYPDEPRPLSHNVRFDDLIEKCRIRFAKKEITELTNEDFHFYFSDKSEVIERNIFPYVLLFVPAGNEKIIEENINLYLCEHIRASICGNKCVQIYFEEFKQLETFLEKFLELYEYYYDWEDGTAKELSLKPKKDLDENSDNNDETSKLSNSSDDIDDSDDKKEEIEKT